RDIRRVESLDSRAKAATGSAAPAARFVTMGPMRKLGFSLSCLLAAALLGGCALFAPKLQAPSLAIVNVELLKSDLWEQRLKVRMRVQNPNDRALPVRGLSYTIDVSGQEFASGVSGESFTVPARGEAEFNMNVTANMAGTLFKLL